MIHRLRRRHRLTFVGLAIGLPLVFAAGLWSRPAGPPSPSFPAALSDVAGALGDTRIRIAGTPFAIVVEDDRITVGLDPSAGRDARRSWPDVLVYWSPSRVTTPEQLADAVLLGPLPTLRSVTHVLPRPGGFLTLFSGAHDDLVGTVRLPAEGGADGS